MQETATKSRGETEMDGAKVLAKVVIAVGLVGLLTGSGFAPWVRVPSLLRYGVDPIPLVTRLPVLPRPPAADLNWFQMAKPSCNAVEVDGYLRANPFPTDWNGSAHGAACLALAGHIEDARAVIMALPSDQQWQTAGVVFEAGHPAADAGDDVAAGPLMELVVDFWPNHYMALYHAGAARYQKGNRDQARKYLEEFLKTYDQNDGWTENAQTMLADLGS